MTFGELFILAGTGTAFSVFLGENRSRHIDILDSDLGSGTEMSESLNRLMEKKVIRYIAGFSQCSRTKEKRPHMTVVLDVDGESYETKAIRYAEEHGIVEYEVNGYMMEYWTFYGKSEGWMFVRVDLDSGKEVFRGANIPWDPKMTDPIPKFMKNDKGWLKYNYMEG